MVRVRVRAEWAEGSDVVFTATHHQWWLLLATLRHFRQFTSGWHWMVVL